MKNITLVISLIIIFAVTAIAQPKLEIIGGDVYDWGEITPNDSPLNAKILLKNSGSDTLHITKVKPTCGCTTAPLSKDKLAPGEVADLNVSLRISSSSKNVTKTVHIYSDDPESSKKTLFLKANVHRPIDVLPRNYFRFVEMTVGNESVASVDILNNTKEDIVFSEIQTKPAGLAVDLKKGDIIKPGERKTVTAKVSPEKTGYFSCQVIINTSYEDVPELKIQGYGSVKESPIFVR